MVNNFLGEYGGSYNMITQEIKSWAKDFTEVGFKHETELRTLKLIG
jgi:hypothetical protein